MPLEELAERAWKEWVEGRDGFTVGMGDAEPSGYGVGGYGTTLSIPSWSLSPLALRSYVQQNLEALAERGAYLGGWFDSQTGNVYLDVTRTFDTEAEALAESASKGELAIWDFANSREIRLERTKSHAQ